MHEITKRTTAKNADGHERVFLPGRITKAEAEAYGLIGGGRSATTTKTRKRKS